MKSPEEIWAAVQALSPAELRKLESYARWRMKSVGRKAFGRNAKDLLEEATIATVEGRRRWKEGVDFFQHLIGAMRSISSSWRAATGEEYLESEFAKTKDESTLLQRSVTTVDDPERIVIAKEQLDLVRRLFAKDVPASQVIELLGLEYTGKEIQSQLGLSEHEYQAISKRIRRKLQTQLTDLYSLVRQERQRSAHSSLL